MYKLIWFVFLWLNKIFLEVFFKKVGFNFLENYYKKRYLNNNYNFKNKLI